MSPHAKPEDLRAGLALLGEKGEAHGRGSQSPKEKFPNPTARRKVAQMKGRSGGELAMEEEEVALETKFPAKSVSLSQ